MSMLPTNQPVTLEQLLQLAGQGQLSQTPKLLSPSQQGYAPGGPQVNFLGGSPFPVNETPAIVQNGLVLLTQLNDVIRRMRSGGGQAGGAGAPPGPVTTPALGR